MSFPKFEQSCTPVSELGILRKCNNLKLLQVSGKAWKYMRFDSPIWLLYSLPIDLSAFLKGSIVGVVMTWYDELPTGYWRKQMEHICEHLKAHAANSPDFRNLIKDPKMGKVSDFCCSVSSISRCGSEHPLFRYISLSNTCLTVESWEPIEAVT